MSKEVLELFNLAFTGKQWETVIYLKDEVLNVLHATGSTQGEAVFFVNLGIAYKNIGDFNKAIECQESALTLYKRLGNKIGTGYCYTNLGNAYHELGMLKKAEKFQQRALKIAARTGDQKLYRICMDNKDQTQKARQAKTIFLKDGGKTIRFAPNRDRFHLKNKSTPHNSNTGSTVVAPAERNKVFVSYSHHDRSIVEPIVKKLVQLGIQVFYDSEDNPGNDVHSLTAGLSRGLSQCLLLLVFYSRNLFKSAWCRAEIRGFMHHSVIETGCTRPPVLIVDIDGSSSDSKIEDISFEEPPLIQGDSEIQDIERLTIAQSIRQETEKILAKQRLKTHQVVKAFRKISYDPGNIDHQVEQVAGELINIKSTWLQTAPSPKGTFSDSIDLDQIWEEDLTHHNPSTAPSQKRKIMNALVSNVPKTAPIYKDASQLWDYVWNQYKHKTIAKEIVILEALREYTPPGKFDETVKGNIEKYRDDTLLAMMEGIHKGRDSITLFDRSRFQGTVFYKKWFHRIMTGTKHIQPGTLQGHPLHLMFGDSQRRKLLQPLQYTYYHYRKKRKKCELVDTAVFAALLINIDMWFEVLRDKEEFYELILTPLAAGKDIRSQFPG